MKTVKEKMDDIIDVLLNNVQRPLVLSKKAQLKIDREQWLKSQQDGLARTAAFGTLAHPLYKQIVW